MKVSSSGARERPIGDILSLTVYFKKQGKLVLSGMGRAAKQNSSFYKYYIKLLIWKESKFIWPKIFGYLSQLLC